MVFRIEPKFPECRECQFYHPRRLLSRCLKCGAGEYFEERFDDRELNETELMKLYTKMALDNDDTD